MSIELLAPSVECPLISFRKSSRGLHRGGGAGGLGSVEKPDGEGWSVGDELFVVPFVLSSGKTVVEYLICAVRMLRFCSHGLSGLDG